MIVATINNKGGVGKTTTVASLGAALARKGQRVLVVDLDAQASLTRSLGVPRGAGGPSVADVLLGGAPMAGAVRATATADLDLVAATMELASLDTALADVTGRERVLAEALADVAPAYDFVLLDCPPGIGLVAVNALLASDALLVPVQPQYLALEGLANLLGVVEGLRANMGARAQLLGLVVTMADYRQRTTLEAIGAMREAYGADVCGPEIRVNVRLSEAPSHGKTIFEYDASSPGAEAYAMLARDILGRARRMAAGQAAVVAA